jgi:uroporphyrinogen decarboxylase
MRQAGRTDPQYRAYKEKLALPLEDMFRNPEVSAHMTILPARFGVDALIYYQDILTILGPMGAEFIFRPGPEIVEPFAGPADLSRLRAFDVREDMSYVAEAIDLILKRKPGDLPLLGFAGSPLTLAVFLIEGRSFGKGIEKFQSYLQHHPKELHALLKLLTRMTVEYLQFQAHCGVSAVQLFESAAHLLTREQYQTFALPYQQEIFSCLRGLLPTIIFAHNWPILTDLSAAGADVISLPASISIKEARAALGADIVLQGNISNHLLRDGTLEDIRSAVLQCIGDGGCYRHILNLDHGLLPETPFENVCHAIKIATEYKNPTFP